MGEIEISINNILKKEDYKYCCHRNIDILNQCLFNLNNTKYIDHNQMNTHHYSLNYDEHANLEYIKQVIQEHVKFTDNNIRGRIKRGEELI